MLAEIETTGDIITVTLCIIFLSAGIPFMIMGFLHKHFKSTWFCNTMGWHIEPGGAGFDPGKVGFDGCSMTGQCPRCHNDIMMDGQGNWF